MHVLIMGITCVKKVEVYIIHRLYVCSLVTYELGYQQDVAKAWEISENTKPSLNSFHAYREPHG